jgi:hypothetical protein
MNTLLLENQRKEIYLIFDTQTGDVLWTHEEYVEFSNTKDNKIQNEYSEISEKAGKENNGETEIFLQAQQAYSDKKLDMIKAPEKFSLQENQLLRIDIKTKHVVEEKMIMPSLAERLRDS